MNKTNFNFLSLNNSTSATLIGNIFFLVLAPLALVIASFGFLFAIFPSELITDSSILCLPDVSYCQGAEEHNFDNDYWKIENIKTNMWRVLFRNVGITYEIRQTVSDTDVKDSVFEFREIGPNYPGVFDNDSLLKLTEEELLKYWDKHNQGYKFVKDGSGALYLTGSADGLNVYFCERHTHIIEATREHFNNIQRGNYHPNSKNVINPNSHGKSTNMLSQVKNTFATNKNGAWPHNHHHGSGSDRSGSSDSEELSRHEEKSKQVKRDIRSPLDQFIIMDLIIIILPLLASLEFSFTNMTLYLSISTLTIIIIYILPLLWEKIKTSPWFITTISILHTVYNFVKSQIQVLKGINFLPLFACLFIYILVNNLIGMIPYTFAPTSHFILTFFLSFSIVVGCSLLGLIIHRLEFFSLFTPQGCPLGLLPLLVLIEAISYLARNVSLGLRLAANILSGHMLLNILSEFTYKIMDTDIIYFFIGIIPLIFIGGFSALELGIGFIQAQVFVVLSSSYTKDSIELH